MNTYVNHAANPGAYGPLVNDNFEFVKYIPTPEDGNQIGVAEVRTRTFNKKGEPLKITLRYKWVQTKDGGHFPASGSVCITRNGEKKYPTCAQCDSNSDDDDLKEFIRANVKYQISLQSIPVSATPVAAAFQTQPPIQQPLFQAPPMQNPSSGAASNDQLPF
jgi:hypothetical protein